MDNIKEGSKIIAEFDGWKLVFDTIGGEGKRSYNHWVKGDKRIRDFYFHPQYHTSWDWLVEPIKKFKRLDLDNIEYRSWVEEIDNSVIDEYDIMQAFKTFAGAINWYNQNK